MSDRTDNGRTDASSIHEPGSPGQAGHGAVALVPPRRSEAGLSSSERAANYMRRLIFEGHLAPGSRIPQVEIAEVLGTSRMPVREALVALEKEGRVVLERNRGAFVAVITEESTREISHILGMIDAYIAQKFAERASEDDFARLRTIVADLEKTTDPTELYYVTIRFRECLLEIGTPARFAVFLRGLWSLGPENYFEAVPEAITVTRQHMPQMLAALESGDRDRIADEFDAWHLANVECTVRRFRERGLLVPEGEPAPSR